MVKVIKTQAIEGQVPGTSGLRKKVKIFQQPHYLENFIQSIIAATESSGKTLVIGGDGRFFNKEAIQTIIRIAAANAVEKLIIGQNGILSTPAASHLIRKYKAHGGIILSASHNPGGEDGDFGIKFNNESGSPAPENITQAIYAYTRSIKEYYIVHKGDIDLSKIGTLTYEGMIIDVIDPVEDYANMLEDIFDFAAIGRLFVSGFTLTFDAMHAVTGPYAKEIFEHRLGAQEGSVINAQPKEDFAGGHPDPNLTWAKELVEKMYNYNASDLGAASDGDGDRNMILGKSFFVSPSESLAVIIANHEHIKGYEDGASGVARSMPTSIIVDKVAAALELDCYEVPTGWKFFGNLLDTGKITFCGEESFGTGSNHIREKDGLWAVLYWLNMIAVRGKSVEELVREIWVNYGRAYYMRHDFEEVSVQAADDVMMGLKERLQELQGQNIRGKTIQKAEDFHYHDPVDGSISENQGIYLIFDDESRIIFRRSGTGTQGATLRIYMEMMEYDPEHQDEDPKDVLQPLVEISWEVSQILTKTNRTGPDVVT